MSEREDEPTALAWTDDEEIERRQEQLRQSHPEVWEAWIAWLRKQ